MESAPYPPILERPSIDFRRTRDAGGVINVTFAFLRENWQGLVRATIFLVGPVYLVLLVMQAAVVSTDLFLLGGFVNLAQRLLLVTLVQTLVTGYILLYVEHGRDGVSLGDLRALLRSDVAAVFGVLVLSLLASLFASVLLLLPGIYLFVATSVAVPVRMAEESTVTSAISRSMELVHHRWWQTFGILLLVGIVALLLSTVVQLPTWLVALFAAEAFAAGAGEMPVAISVVVLLLEAIATVIASLIVDTAILAQYFNLVEQKEGPGMMARIEEIGAEGMDSSTASSYPGTAHP